MCVGCVSCHSISPVAPDELVPCQGRCEFLWQHPARLQLLLAQQDNCGLQQRTAGRQRRQDGEEATREAQVVMIMITIIDNIVMTRPGGQSIPTSTTTLT